MNKEEIKHFKSLLRQGSLRHMNILLDDKFQKELQIIIKDYEKLQQENKQLKEIIKENTILVKDEYGDYQECNINPLGMKQKYEKQVDNWNKLKEHIKSEWTCFDNESVEFEVSTDILDKMQELQGSDSDE